MRHSVPDTQPFLSRSSSQSQGTGSWHSIEMQPKAVPKLSFPSVAKKQDHLRTRMIQLPSPSTVNSSYSKDRHERCPPSLCFCESAREDFEVDCQNCQTSNHHHSSSIRGDERVMISHGRRLLCLCSFCPILFCCELLGRGRGI